MLDDAVRMFFRRIRVAFFGFKQYSGSASEICAQIVQDCWNGRYFQTSTGHFKSFYTRDFGLCVPSLIKLGYEKEVGLSLEWALAAFERVGKVTTSISPSGKPFDFPTLAPDSLAFLLFSLSYVPGVLRKHKSFVEKEVLRYVDACVGVDGLPKKQHFSSMKDHAIRQQSCYDATMLGWISVLLNKLKLSNPLKKFDYRDVLKKNYWSGSYFRDDMSGNEYVSGDANVFPFWCGVVKDKMMLRKAVASIERSGLVTPFPLKYTKTPPVHKWIAASWVAPNYEGTTVWAHLGVVYLDVLSRHYPLLLKKHLRSYKLLVEKHKTFLEVYHPDGTPYKTLMYISDEGMVWGSVLLVVMNKL